MFVFLIVFVEENYHKKKQQFLKALYIFSFFVDFVFTSWLSLKLMMARNYRKIRLEVEKKENEKR